MPDGIRSDLSTWWFVNHLSKRGQKISAREFVTTGSCTEVYDDRLYDHVKADFGMLGSVGATFTS